MATFKDRRYKKLPCFPFVFKLSFRAILIKLIFFCDKELVFPVSLLYLMASVVSGCCLHNNMIADIFNTFA